MLMTTIGRTQSAMEVYPRGVLTRFWEFEGLNGEVNVRIGWLSFPFRANN